MMKHRSALLFFTIALFGCADDEDRAPLLQPSGGVTDPISCDELRVLAPEPNDQGRFWVAGTHAACVSEGQWCPAAWIEERCDGGAPFVRCIAGEWGVLCADMGEAGVSDADAVGDGDGDA